MPSNREILYSIRMRVQAREAVRQLTADLAAQGTTLKHVARGIQEAQVQTGRLGTTSARSAREVSGLAAAAKQLGDAAKGVAAFSRAIAAASGKANGFGSLQAAVDGLDRVLRTSSGIGVYRARLLSLQTLLAQLPAQFAAAAAAAAALSGVAPPRPPRGSGSAGAPPPSNGPPRTGGGSGTPWGSGQAGFNQALGATQSKLGEIRTSLSQVAALTLTAFGARKVLEMADEYTRIVGQLRLVTTGTQNLNDTYAELRKTADDNRAGFGATVDIYAKFNKATRTLGVSQREVIETTDAVNKAVAIFGGPAASAEAALFQFSQGLSAGALRGEELNSVMEQAPRLAQAIADGLKNTEGSIGIPIGALRTYAEQGKLTTEAVFNALRNQRPKLEAEYKQTGTTISQAFTVARNAVIDYVGKADEATGTSRKVGEAIIVAVKSLQTASAVSGAQNALELFGRAVTGAISAVTFLANNLQLAATAFVAFKALSLAPTFAAMGAAAVSAASSLAVYNVATRSVAIGATVANVAVNGLNAGMRLFGGPIGIAITLAATAMAYWVTQSKSSVETSTQLAEVTEKLRGNYDAAANAVKGLSDAERARDQLRLQGLQKSLSGELQSQAKAVNNALAGGFFEATDGSRLAARFQPFRAEILTWRKSVAEGKADFDALQKAVAQRAQGNPALADAAREIDEAAQAGAKFQAESAKAGATLRVLEGNATRADGAISSLRSTLDAPPSQDGFLAIQQANEAIKVIAANVPQLKAVAEAKASLSAADEKYAAVQRDLKVALDAGALSTAQYQERVNNAAITLQRAKDAINGVTQAHRELRDAQRDLGLDGLVDRERAIESINIRYDRQIRSLKEGVHEQGKLNELVREQNNLRQQEIGNLDVKFQNGDLRDRVLSLQNEARLLDLTGNAHERASRLLDVEAAARRAGVSNVQGMVDAYAKEYDALQKAAQARQTVGNGFNRAVTDYVETASRVGDESARMFSGVFDSLETGFVDVFRTGTNGFKSMLDNIASDLMRFASRQLFRTLLSSVFGDGQGGMGGSGGSFGNSIMQALGGASMGRAGVAAPATSTGVGGALSTAAGAAASGVVKLADAASTATGRFGDIPSKLTSMLKGLGATDAGVAGFLGNVQRESTFDPAAVNKTSGAYGLIQALGPRKAELFKQYGPNPSANDQVAFIRNELLTTEGASLKMLRNASTLSDGVKAGVRFERPEGYVDALRAGDLSQVPDFGKRLGYAGKFGSISQSQTPEWKLDGLTLNEDSVSKLNSQFDEISTKTAGLDTSFSQMGNALDRANPQIMSGVDGVTGSLRAGGSNIGQAFSEASSNITKGGNSLFTALQEMASKAGGSVLSLGKNVFDIGSGWSGDGFDLSAGKLSDWMHSGGIVGQGQRVSGKADTSLWDNAPKFHTGGIVGPGAGLKSRERAIIAKDEEAIFPTVRMPDGNFGIRATGFTGGGSGGGGGGGGNITFGDINIQTSGSSGNAEQDQAHAKAMAREMKESLRALVREEMQQGFRDGGAYKRLGNF